jgi:hypothetical protein
MKSSIRGLVGVVSTAIFGVSPKTLTTRYGSLSGQGRIRRILSGGTPARATGRVALASFQISFHDPQGCMALYLTHF